MQKEKKLKQNKLWFLALLTHSSACNEINFKEAKGKYLNSMFTINTVRPLYQLFGLTYDATGTKGHNDNFV